jgi:hypothetical protein
MLACRKSTKLRGFLMSQPVQTVHLGVIVREEQRQALTKLAEREDRSVSSVTRAAIDAYLASQHEHPRPRSRARTCSHPLRSARIRGVNAHRRPPRRPRPGHSATTWAAACSRSGKGHVHPSKTQQARSRVRQRPRSSSRGSCPSCRCRSSPLRPLPPTHPSWGTLGPRARRRIGEAALLGSRTCPLQPRRCRPADQCAPPRTSSDQLSPLVPPLDR